MDLAGLTVRIAQPHVRHGDPAVTSDDPSRLSIHACLFDALVRREKHGRFRPGLAESWTLSEDARTWTFELFGARFSDGKPLKATHVVDALVRVRDEDIEGELGTSGVIRGYLQESEIDGSGSSVRIRTPEPLADLLDLLVDLPISRDGIGTGPYRLEASGDDRVLLERVAGRGPEKLEFVAVADRGEREQADVDIATDVAPSAGSVRAPTTVCTTFLCNLSAGPCSSRPFRRALNWATDVEALIDSAVGGAGVPVRGPWTARHLGYDASLPPYGHRPDEARRLLEESGADREVTLDVPERLPDESRHLASRLAEMWAEVGVTTRVNVHRDRPAYALMVRDKRIQDAACFDSSPSSTFRLLWEKFHSGNRGPWWQGYDSAELNRIVDRARATASLPARERLYRQAFRLLHSDAPWVFLYSPQRCFRVSDALRDWRPSPDGYAIFH